MRQRQQPLAYSLALGALVSAIVLIAYMSWKIAFPGDAITMLRPMRILPGPGFTTVLAGKPVTVVFDYCKYSKQHATVGAYLMSLDDSPTVIPIGMHVTSLPLGCRRARMLMVIPDYTPPGRYIMGHTREYRPSAFDHKTYQFLSDPFYVSQPE